MTDIEAAALRERYDSAHRAATLAGTAEEFSGLSRAVAETSHVVVAMPLLFARTFLSDRRTLYTGYEALLNAPTRAPAPFDDDRRRQAAGATLFGSYSREIRYGVLSLDGRGLSSYGPVFLRLRAVAISDRTTFLEQNSFTFVAKHSPDTLPHGAVSGWTNRHQLAAAKLQPLLAAGSVLADWALQLVRSGESRADDDMVEAHIFGPFNAAAVESVSFSSFGSSRQDRIDIAVIRELLTENGAAGATP